MAEVPAGAEESRLISIQSSQSPTPIEQAVVDSQALQPTGAHRRTASKKTRKVRIEELTPPSSGRREDRAKEERLEAITFDEGLQNQEPSIM